MQIYLLAIKQYLYKRVTAKKGLIFERCNEILTLKGLMNGDLFVSAAAIVNAESKHRKMAP